MIALELIRFVNKYNWTFITLIYDFFLAIGSFYILKYYKNTNYYITHIQM
jgi:hypothetical protein